MSAENPKAREAQRVLAHEVCTWVHGADATAQAEAATSALWGRGDLADIDEATILAATADLGSSDVAVGQTTIVDLLVGTGLERGRNAARKTIAGGGAYINNVKVADETAVIGPEHLLAGGVVPPSRESLTLRTRLLSGDDALWAPSPLNSLTGWWSVRNVLSDPKRGG